MATENTLSNNQLKWLEKLIQDRISCDISVSQTLHDGVLCYSLQSTINCSRVLIKYSPHFYKEGAPVFHHVHIFAVPSTFADTIATDYLYLPNADYNQQSDLFTKSSTGIVVNCDILGLFYWQMNRLEEYNRQPDCYDCHGRFTYEKSLAFLGGYIQLPIVDHWMQFLSGICSYLWPKIQLRQHTFTISLSHDVDRIGLLKSSHYKIHIKHLAANLMTCNIKACLYHICSVLFSDSLLSPADPFNTFDFLMKAAKDHHINSTFLFIPRNGPTKYDAKYTLSMPYVKKLISKILKKGHSIGLHPSYQASTSLPVISEDYKSLIQTLAQLYEKLPTTLFNRFHYLRWSWPLTLSALDQFGQVIDSSLSFPSKSGFRCGTCFEYYLYNHVEDRVTGVLEKPLIIMDKTLTSQKYSHASLKSQLDYGLSLKSRCREVNGNFEILWHNGNLGTQQLRSFLLQLLEK